MSRLHLASTVLVLVSACGGGSGDDNPGNPDAMPPSTVCSDGFDNDGDGSIDYPADPGCDSATDPDESNAPIAMCMDGRDNDGDGKTDYPEDPGCLVALQNSETDDCPDGPNCPICSNGMDDDGDGATDYPMDDGCMAASGQDEYGTDPNACGPGLTVTRLDTPTVTGMLMGTSHITSTCGGGGGEVPYELIITEPSVIVATTDFPDTTVDTSLYIRSDCMSPSTELVCNDNLSGTTLNSQITVSVAPGRYYLIVDARTTGETGNYKLGYSLYAGEGTPCMNQSECGPGLQCRIPDGGTEQICTQPVCSDAFDDDGDGFNDFPDDPGCQTPGDFDETDDCPSGPNCPACANGIDDDGDGGIDFGPGGDPDCQYAGQPAEGCNNESDPIQVMTTSTVSGSTVGLTDDFLPSCSFGFSGPDAVWLVSLPAMQNFHVDDAGTSYTGVLALHDQTCMNQLGCDLSFSFGGDFIDSGPLAAGAYAIIMDGYSGASGAYSLHISGDIAPHGDCTGPLATSGVISCPVGYACLGGECLGNLECNNGMDDDGDGKIDYPEEPGCVGPNDTTEADDCPSGPNCPQCSNSLDDDGDGDADYGNDVDCLAASDDDENPPTCTGETDPQPAFTSGTLTGTTVGAADNEQMSCDFGFGTGPDVIATADLPAMQSLHIDSIGTSFDDVLALKDPSCGSELGCQDFGGPGGESVDVTNIPAGVYNVVMDGYDGLSGAYTIHLSGTIAPLGACDGALASSGAISCPSGYACTGGICLGTLECNNGVDDDGDGFPGYPTDPGCANPNDDDESDNCPSGPGCATCSNNLDDDGNGDIDYPDDPSCIAAGGTEGTCGFDTDGVTEIVIPLYSGTTIGLTNDFTPTCYPSSIQADRAFSITLPQPVQQLHVDTAGSDFYTALSVTDATCTATLGCDLDSAGFGNSVVNLTSLPAGNYGIIVDGYFSDGNFMLGIRGTVPSGAACTDPLFSTGVLVCPANHICTAGTCQPL